MSRTPTKLSRVERTARPGWLVVLALLLVLTACTPAATAVQVPTETAVPEATDTAVPPATATTEPTAVPTGTSAPTPTSTPTPLPSATPVPALALLENGLSGWCLPEGAAVPPADAVNPAQPPVNARPATFTDGRLNLVIPSSSCILVFAFNQAVPEGTMIRFLQAGDANAWLSTPLVASSADPTRAVLVISQPYFVGHPYWEVLYPFEIQAGASEIEGAARTYRPFPGLCWEGTMPDPLTQSCPVSDPLEREPHPDVTMPVPPTQVP